MSAECTSSPLSTCSSVSCSFSATCRVGVVVDGVEVVVVDVGLAHGDGRPGLVQCQRVVVQDHVGGHQLGQAGHRRRLLGPRRHVDADGRDRDGSLPGGRPRERHGTGRDVHRAGQDGCRPRARAPACSAARRRKPRPRRPGGATPGGRCAAARADGAGAPVVPSNAARARGSRAARLAPARAACRAGTAPP